MVLLIVSAFWHCAHGLKVVIDDYVHEDGSRFVVNILLLFLAVGGARDLALFAMLKIAFGAAA